MGRADYAFAFLTTASFRLSHLAHRLRGRDEFPELWISLQLLILTGRQAGSVEEILQRVAT